MRIAIPYTFDDKNWQGGRNYFQSLLSAVQAVAPSDVQMVLVTGRKTATTLPKEFPAVEVVRTSAIDRYSLAWTYRQARRQVDADSDPVLARVLRGAGIDLLSHGGGLGQGAGVRALGWLPDFQFVHFPAYWIPAQKRRTERMYNTACRTCDAIVVSSHDALNDLRQFAPWADLPMHVLHFISSPVRVDTLRSLDSLRAQYGLAERFFHLPNQFWVHKNHRLVVDALALLKNDGLSLEVVCTGLPADLRQPSHFDELMAHAKRLGVSENFRVLGLVPYVDMQSLMAHAHAVINPSRFEGWSTTVEEAKTLGRRLLLSDIAVHREQQPKGGKYFQPEDAAALAALMRAAHAADPLPLDSREIEANHQRALQAFGRTYLDIVRTL